MKVQCSQKYSVIYIRYNSTRVISLAERFQPIESPTQFFINWSDYITKTLCSDICS